MKNIVYIRFAAVVAAVIGLMPIVAGIKVLSGAFVPDYNVLTWLVKYNLIMGITSVLIGIVLWFNHKFSTKLTAFIAIAHITVLSLLLTVFSEIVAEKSIKAMVFRAVVWVLLFVVVCKKSNHDSIET